MYLECSGVGINYQKEGNMTNEELKEWNTLRKQLVNGYHVSEWDIKTLIRLNYLVMEEAHKIHNNNMMNTLCNCGINPGFHKKQDNCKTG